MSVNDGIIPIRELNGKLQALMRELTQEEVVVVHKKLTFDVLAGCVTKTPVDEGTARAGWQVSIDLPASEQPNPHWATDPVLQGQPVINAIRPFCTTFVTNDVYHVLVLDQGGFIPQNPGPSKDERPGRFGKVLVGGGYSLQAPHGMVDITLAEIAAGIPTL